MVTGMALAIITFFSSRGFGETGGYFGYMMLLRKGKFTVDRILSLPLFRLFQLRLSEGSFQNIFPINERSIYTIIMCLREVPLHTLLNTHVMVRVVY